MFIDHLAVKSYSAPEERNVPAPPRFRCSAAFKVGVAPQFYKHFVPLGLKTTTKNRKLLFCDDFRNATLDCPLVWSSYFLTTRTCKPVPGLLLLRTRVRRRAARTARCIARSAEGQRPTDRNPHRLSVQRRQLCCPGRRRSTPDSDGGPYFWLRIRQKALRLAPC